METINDIVREMCKDIPRVVDAKVILRNYADRIEAAHKREREATCKESLQVGNAAAMRTALMEIQLICWKAGGSMGYDVACGIIKAKSRAALAKPPRNCDLYANPKEAGEAFISESCENPCGNCTVSDECHNPLIHECGINWLFAEAKGEQK